MFLTFRPRGPPRPWRLSLWTTGAGPCWGRDTCSAWSLSGPGQSRATPPTPPASVSPPGARPQPAAQRGLSPHLFPSPRRHRLLSGIPKRERPLIKVSDLVFLFALPSFAAVGAFPSHPRPARGRLLPHPPPPDGSSRAVQPHLEGKHSS